MPTPEDPHQPGSDDARRERLVLIALGEPVEDAFERHVSTCAECREDLNAYRHSVALARAGGDDRSALEEVPPPSVWAGISRSLSLDSTAPEATGHGTTAADVSATDAVSPSSSGRHAARFDAARAEAARAEPNRADPNRAEAHRADTDRPGAVPTSGSGRNGTDDLSRARRRRWRTALVAAAAAIVVGLSVTAGVLIGRDHRSPAATQVLYQGQLSQHPGGPVNVSGQAVVHTQGRGLAVSVAAAGLPLRPGYYQVWLYDPTHKHMLPIGVLGRDGTGTFPLAADVDLRLYDIVDISAQDFDGVYTHKTTVLQGPLRQ